MKGMGVAPIKVGGFCGNPVSCAVVAKHELEASIDACVAPGADCTTADDCTKEDNHATLPPHPHRETMSNADKFIELANGEFPEGALPDQQEYEHPLVKR